MKLINRFFKVIILTTIMTSSCGFKRNSFENYKDDIKEVLNPNSNNLRQIQNIEDVKDMRGCGYMIELSNWYLEKYKDGSTQWGRNRNWKELSGIVSYSGFDLDSNPKDSTPALTQNPLIHIVYIGPWHLSKKVGKEIRFVAYTGKGGGAIFQQFESKTPQNELIFAKEFYLNPKLHNMKDRTGVCLVKWIANNGYNAISKVKSKNPFSKNYMIPTGEIIQVED